MKISKNEDIKVKYTTENGDFVFVITQTKEKKIWTLYKQNKNDYEKIAQSQISPLKLEESIRKTLEKILK